jgi:hypothetical protein
MTIYTWNTFIKPKTSTDKSLKIIDDKGLITYTINPFSVVNAYVSANLLQVRLKSGKIISIPFSSLNESQLALPRIQFVINELKKTTPVLVDDALKSYVESKQTQFFSGSTASNTDIREGALCYDANNEQLLVYAKDKDGNLDWIETSNKSTSPEFFYQDSQPTGTGTNAINVGSFWYDTTDGTLYLYVQDSVTKQFNWISAANSQSVNQFFYQDNQPAGTGTNTINIGSFWYDTTDGIFYIYVRDTNTGQYFWVTASTSFSTGNLFEFFYQSDQPEGTGTGEIPVGSLWYDTEDGTLFVYVRNINSSGYAWVTSYGAVGPEGPMGATGPAGSTTEVTNGTSGTSGTSGATGSSGTSGLSGTSGTSGSSGDSGTSGSSGSSGFSGTSGDSGTSGTSGTSGITPTTSLSLSESLTVTGTSTFNGLAVLQEVTEVINSTPGATSSTVVYDFTTGSNWYHSSANTNYTANFINIPTTDNRATTLTIVINQGSTAYIPTAVQIDGNCQTIKWAGGTASGTSNQVDVIGFTFIRTGGDWAQVLGQINTFD